VRWIDSPATSSGEFCCNRLKILAAVTTLANEAFAAFLFISAISIITIASFEKVHQTFALSLNFSQKEMFLNEVLLFVSLMLHSSRISSTFLMFKARMRITPTQGKQLGTIKHIFNNQVLCHLMHA